MADDLFDVIERLFGIDADSLRKLARERSDRDDIDIADGVFGLDITSLRNLAERNDVDWDFEADTDHDWLSDATRSSGESRRGLGSRPGGPRRSRSRVNTRQNRYSCPTCGRNFLTYTALQRHYDSNPTHAEMEIDVRDIDVDDTGLAGPGWVELADSIETFVTVPDDVEEADLDVEYSPDDEVVIISGAYDNTLDASAITAHIESDMSWGLRGSFLLISFPKQDSSAS